MARARLFFAGLLIAATSFAAMPSDAGVLCYHVKLYNKNKVMIDRWVGLCAADDEPVSVTTQRIGDTIVETTRYA